MQVDVARGHFQEFRNVASSYLYAVVDGRGTFVLDDERVEVGPGDLVVAPPGTRIHYFGTMRLVLTVTPAFDESDEEHVRFVAESESPYT
ncbi:cupin domain-containing protein [Nocardioides convexus]|uniref:cupin domain-containing protein n=1 Tax=Nocardioides convexus TaxID=2712224 RepID=UPI0024182ABC|nr:cupin domain-containing protein [Nocardioides convexus]